jgi:hypothetical protein
MNILADRLFPETFLVQPMGCIPPRAFADQKKTFS